MLKIFISILLVLIVTSRGLPNTPPQLSFDREWTLTEDEPVGSVVTRIRVSDAENSHINITIGSPSSSAFQGRTDGATYFAIDKNKRVLLAKPLIGLAGQTFLVGIIASDGKLLNRIDARVSVRKANDRSNSFIPSGFSSSFLPSQVSPPLRGANEDDKIIGPPLLHLDPNTVWVVPSDAEAGTEVTVVEAQNLRDAPLRFSLSPNQVLEIDPQSGRVKTSSSLIDKIGNHVIKVNVSDNVDYITEKVILRVKPVNGSSVNVQTFDSSSELTLSPVQRGSATSEEVENALDNSPKILIPDKAVKPTTNHSYTNKIIIAIVVVGIVTISAFVYWRFRRNNNPEANKEGSMSYNEKRGSIGTVQAGRRDSIISGFLSFVRVRQRAESNGYEEELKIPNIPHRDSRKSSNANIFTGPDENGEEKWEFPRHKIKVLGILGEGCFGQVWKCEAVDLVEKGPKTVAVKTLKESAGQAEHNDLLQELKVLKSLSYHPNVVSLLGCCTEKEPIFVILEYMSEGKLQSYLRSSRAGHSYGNLHGVSSSLTPRDLTIFALQVARGMDFLSKNGIIHRDLAARNVLVGDNKVCKVADFGFARDVANNHVYERKSDGRLPIRWMARESLFDNLFTTKSDVWSFGILLWEIVTLGSTPYPGMSAAEVMRRVNDGYRLEKPEHCRREIYNIMYYCWDFDEKERPSFPELVKSLEALIMTEVDYIQLEKFPEHSYYNFNSVSTSAELL